MVNTTVIDLFIFSSFRHRCFKFSKLFVSRVESLESKGVFSPTKSLTEKAQNHYAALKEAERKRMNGEAEESSSPLTDVMNKLAEGAKALEESDYWLETVIPKKPDYFSKLDRTVTYYSGYNYLIQVTGPQKAAATLGILFGVVAIVMAIPSMGGSLYIAAIGAAEIAVGAMQIKISSEKLRDLNAGNNYSSPKVFGMDQEAVNTADIVVSVVGLSILFKPNNLKAADQFKDSQRLAAFKSTMNDVNIKMNPANYKFYRERVGALSTGNGSLNRGFTRYWIERNGDKPFIQFTKGKGGGDGGPKPKPHEVDPPSPPKDPIEGTGEGGLSFPTRLINLETESHFIQRVSELKGRLSNGALNKSGANFGYAEVDIPGIKNEFYAHSQVDGPSPPHQPDLNYDGFSYKPQGKVRYPAEDAPNRLGKIISRNSDTEHKIINDLANQLGPPDPNIKGKIKLFTENNTCISCNKNISAFHEDYPGITIEVIHNGGNKVPKK